MQPQSHAWPEATQVKEKLGTLRFYLGNTTEAASALIHNAVEKSAKTCEVCGNPGLPVVAYGVKTLCENHKNKFIEH